jgi:hypothetical protein
MSKQSEIFARYRSLFNNSAKQIENEQSRKLNNLDFVDFLFELVKSTKGQSQFKNIILKGSLSKLNKTDELNKTIQNSIISTFGCDSSLLIPTKYTTKSISGINIDKNELDAFGMLGINPTTKPGTYIYEGNNPNKHVNYLLYKAQSATSTNPLNIEYQNNVLFSVYSSTPNTFVFRFGEFYEHKMYSIWLSDYMSLINPIFNMVNFTTTLTDIITGAVSIKANKSTIEIKKQTAVIKAMQKLFGFCSEKVDSGGTISNSANNLLSQNNPDTDSTNIRKQVGFGNLTDSSDDPFNFTFQDLEDIEQTANLRAKGVIRFSTCGDLDLNMSPDDILNGLDELFSNSDVADLYSYDNPDNGPLPNTQETTNVIFDNANITPNVDKSANFFDNAIKNGAQQAINSGESNVIIDLPNIHAEIQLNILKAIPYALMQMILSPKIILVPKLYSALSGDVDKKPVNSLIKNMSGVIKEVGAQITSLLIKNIFDAIKSDLTKLAKQLAVQFLKQRGLDYFATLNSLLGVLNNFGSKTTCGSVLDKLLSLLKLSNFGPMPMIPPPLVMLNAVKPGMNSVSLINDIKANLTEKGIETAATLPDGTPNNLMLAIEETVKSMISHIKTNATIQTFGVGASGPVQGYGQIQ